MKPRISVVIPAFNAGQSIAEAVRAVVSQPVSRELFECIVVDDGSGDDTASVAAGAGATVVRLPKNCGRCAARNAGIEHARGDWIAFTDADCVPSRRWLPMLVGAAEAAERPTLALAGKTIGLDSRTPAARFMDLVGALDAETYLDNREISWAPTANLACRREDLLAVGGFDTNYRLYETAEMILRLTDRFGGRIEYLPSAIVLHRHRATWREFWKQQVNYGDGYAQFLLRHAERWPWSLCREIGAWSGLIPLAFQAAGGRGDQGLVRRGLFLKRLAYRFGFAPTYFCPVERRRARAESAARAPISQATLAGSGLPLWLGVGHFISRAPARLGRTELPVFLTRLASQPRGDADYERVARLTHRWLRLPGLRSRDTCYLRSLVLFRYVSGNGGDLCVHFGVDEPRHSGERLHGHAWVSLEGRALNPPESLAQGRLREIYRFSSRDGGSSASGAAFAGAMMRRGGEFPATARRAPA
jgi:glycosyltransferase involved in cell wall biosynthesis